MKECSLAGLDTGSAFIFARSAFLRFDARRSDPFQVGGCVSFHAAESDVIIT